VREASLVCHLGGKAYHLRSRAHGDASRAPILAGCPHLLRGEASGKGARARGHPGEAPDLRAPTPILEGETRDDRG
jgi:hypothetical protein